MISNVFLIGILSAPITDTVRYLQVERNYKNSEGAFVTDRIPVIYWTKTANSFFMGLKEGSYVAVRGRMETHDKVGLIVVADHLEYMGGKTLDVLETAPKVV